MINLPTLFVLTVNSTTKNKLQQSPKLGYVEVFNYKLNKIINNITCVHVCNYVYKTIHFQFFSNSGVKIIGKFTLDEIEKRMSIVTWQLYTAYK